MGKEGSRIYPELEGFVSRVQAEAGMIPPSRRAGLEQLAGFIRERKGAGETARLVLICTHNSRRSHLAQVWAWAAAHLHGISGIETFSGGTEATAFNPRAVAALERAGFRIEARAAGENPVYSVRLSDEVAPLECFSKIYDEPPNPSGGFCAIMTCSSADAQCPVVPGAAERIAIRYDDPKAFDRTPEERQGYDERCRQIAREMLHALSLCRD